MLFCYTACRAGLIHGVICPLAECGKSVAQAGVVTAAGNIEILCISYLGSLLSFLGGHHTVPNLKTLKTHFDEGIYMLQLLMGVGKDGDAAGIPDQLNYFRFLLKSR